MDPVFRIRITNIEGSRGIVSSTNFSSVADRYLRSSLVQKSASATLLSLLDLQPGENVLDVGCGTGNITREIRTITNGRTTGIDLSPEMIRECGRMFGNTGIRFMTLGAGDISFENEFDVIFCNSTFQWFHRIDTILSRWHRALRNGGRVGIQAPATGEYCPNFISAVQEASRSPEIGRTFSRFRSPWLFFDTADQYKECFTKNGFRVGFSRIETVESQHRPEEVFGIFSTGAAAGYLDASNYPQGIDGIFKEAFLKIIRAAFERQAGADGMVKLVFHRIYLVAHKA